MTLSMLCGFVSFTFLISKIGTVMMPAHRVAGMMMAESWKALGTMLDAVQLTLLLHFHLSSQLTISLYSWTQSPWTVFPASLPGGLLLDSAHRRPRRREGEGSPGFPYSLSSSSSTISEAGQLLWWPSSVLPAPGAEACPFSSG